MLTSQHSSISNNIHELSSKPSQLMILPKKIPLLRTSLIFITIELWSTNTRKTTPNVSVLWTNPFDWIQGGKLPNRRRTVLSSICPVVKILSITREDSKLRRFISL
uniref:Uncharacterized protein n=1 Tax=Cacopsylla melanoneura TaxID=428564 RepID=A0A8D8XHV4_9HEMI